MPLTLCLVIAAPVLIVLFSMLILFCMDLSRSNRDRI